MKPIIKIFVLSIFASSIAFATTSEEVKEKTKDAAASALDFSKERKEIVQREMEESLATMKEKIAELKVVADRKVGAAKKSATQEVANLEKSQAALSARLNKFKKSSGKAWKNMKAGFNDAFRKLSEAYDKAKDDYK